jgi:1-acyl-sn-glycerol-3-phosphate acyltransferase
VTIDGFEPYQKDAFAGYDARTADRGFSAIDAARRSLGIEVTGLHHIPRGRALLVGNHAFGWDSMFPMAAIFQKLGRRVWVLGEHVWWRVPYLRRVASAMGVVDGTRENVAALLARDELVLVLPGGLREAVKPRELRYQLLWGHRYGFVRAALEARAPLVPIASVGTDELFDFVGNPFRRGRRWLKRRGVPIPLPRRILPIPHRVKIAFRIGEPIPCDLGPEAAHDEAVLRRLRRETAGALHELIEEELAQRAGISLD